MNVSQMLDYVEQTARDQITGRVMAPDRLMLLSWLSHEIADLSSLDQFEFFQIELNPIALTATGERRYSLPTNFGTNFVRTTDPYTNEVRWLCKLHTTTTSEQFLKYEPPDQFYGHNLAGESNAIPTAYTVISRGGGTKLLALSPPPDASTYTLSGVYIPTNWDLDEEDELPPLPMNSSYLKHRLLAKINEGKNTENFALYTTLANNDLAALRLNVAQSRKARFVVSGQMNYRMTRRFR